MKKFIAAIFFLFLFAIPFVYSAGVANSYWDDNPLKLAPGESTTVSLRLQNEETGQITMKGSINSEIASFVNGDEYSVPPDKISVPVYIRVELPKSAEIGAKYTIPVSFKEISSGEGGMLSIAQGITSKIPVLVVAPAESSLYSSKSKINTPLVLGIAILIILITIVIYLYKNRSKPSKR